MLVNEEQLLNARTPIAVTGFPLYVSGIIIFELFVSIPVTAHESPKEVIVNPFRSFSSTIFEITMAAINIKTAAAIVVFVNTAKEYFISFGYECVI